MVVISSHMIPLEHEHNGCNITTTTRWKNRQSTTQPAVAGDLLLQLDFNLLYYTIMDSVAYLPVNNNTLEDVASCRWVLTDTPTCLL